MLRSASFSIAVLLCASRTAFAQVPTPSGPPPAITPEHTAQTRAELERTARQQNEQRIYAEEQQKLEGARYQAWVERGRAKKPSAFALEDDMHGVDAAAYVSAFGGRGTAGAFGMRVAGHVSLATWLGLEARVAIASEAFDQRHFVTTGGLFGVRAETTMNRRGWAYASLGGGVERALSGGSAVPDASILTQATVGALVCVVPIDRGCGGFAVEVMAGLRVPVGGDDHALRLPRGYLGGGLGVGFLF